MGDRDAVAADDGTVYSTTYDGEAELVSAIVGGIASLEDIPVDRVPPLYDLVDLEALATLLGHGRRRGALLGVEFAVGEYTVAVSTRGDVRFYE